VQAGASLEGLQAALERAASILLILTPLVFVFSLLGGWLLLGRALRRVDDLTQTALDIQSTNLERRIEHDGTQDEFGRLAHAFDQMIARLDRSFQQVRRFSSDASHELRTPLTAIRGEAEVALLGELQPDESRRALRNILDSAERMSSIVESLLLLSRADSGQSLIKREPVALAEAVMEAYEQSEPVAARHGVSLVVGEIDDVVVEGDALWLNQVITNLLTNGAKYTPEGGSVTVSLRGEENEAVLRVRDTGIGIPQEHLPHIFDRFYRVDSGRARAAGGVGLGLSITRWAVEEHGGTISVSSEADQGSEFVVRLPLAGESEIEISARKAQNPPARVGG
jgi:two-component system OmpR family sensor kinase